MADWRSFLSCPMVVGKDGLLTVRLAARDGAGSERVTLAVLVLIVRPAGIEILAVTDGYFRRALPAAASSWW
jgi:hypothetical protein